MVIVNGKNMPRLRRTVRDLNQVGRNKIDRKQWIKDFNYEYMRGPRWYPFVLAGYIGVGLAAVVQKTVEATSPAGIDNTIWDHKTWDYVHGSMPYLLFGVPFLVAAYANHREKGNKVLEKLSELSRALHFGKKKGRLPKHGDPHILDSDLIPYLIGDRREGPSLLERFGKKLNDAIDDFL